MKALKNLALVFAAASLTLGVNAQNANTARQTSKPVAVSGAKGTTGNKTTTTKTTGPKAATGTKAATGAKAATGKKETNKK
ncbi:MAG TPA: hypothetical protein VG603_14135 [Chitinophagales bacterium]|nr:hypothetical protein [Chitinophagales bacterium]